MTAAVVYPVGRKENFTISHCIFAPNEKYDDDNNNNYYYNASHQQRRHSIPGQPRKAHHSSY